MPTSNESSVTICPFMQPNKSSVYLWDRVWGDKNDYRIMIILFFMSETNCTQFQLD